MIDWRALAGNGLWIFGLSSLLAAFGYCDWLARVSRRRRADIFKDPWLRFCRNSALFLTAAGWALAQASSWLEKGILLIVAASLLWDVASLSILGRKRTSKTDGDRLAAD